MRVNSQGDAKILPNVKQGEVFMDTMYNFANIYHQNGEIRHSAGIKNKIKPEVMLCIARADSDLGKQLKSTNNFGNVGNNDRGDVVHYKTPQAGINAIARVLHNKYLGKKQTIGDLSPSGGCTTDCTKFYATSEENWNNNVLNCLSHIHNKKINEDFTFRIQSGV